MSDLILSSEVAYDLNSLADTLVKYSTVKDAKPLYDAASKLYALRSDEQYQYECNNLVFSYDGQISGTIPLGVKYLEIILNIEFGGIVVKDNKFGSPVSNLQFDLELHGMDDNTDQYYCAWHLDKHIKQVDDGPNKYVHPDYHLTFGGNKMEGKGNIFGQCLIVPMPRLAHPPMDAILGIDFIIHNFLPIEQKSSLLLDPAYIQVVRNSHIRLWKPYYCAISSAWLKHDDMEFLSDFNHEVLLPYTKFN